VARSELGTKRIDPETGKKFYDLGKDPIVSPYTGKSYPLSFFAVEAPALKEMARAKVVEVADEEEEEVEVEEEEELVADDAELVALEDADEDPAAPRAKEAVVTPDVDGPGDDDLVEDIEIEDEEDEDETFLAEEEDEEEDDVAGYIGGGGRDDED
jgi:uncharacterized protein (TIGR02300 family)